jgi:hypothetical protein
MENQKSQDEGITRKNPHNKITIEKDGQGTKIKF